MDLPTRPYLDQLTTWPTTGRHLLACHDQERVVVYQAYGDDIADWALDHGHLGGPWSLERMSWVKPNFLWMMYRSDWANKAGQERVLAISLQREGFEYILSQAVDSTWIPEFHGPDQDIWRRQGRSAGVRLQWDPDHDPTGQKVERRAIQLGLRGQVLARFAKEWILDIEDITPFVIAQQANARPNRYKLLKTPAEDLYWPADAEVARRLRLSPLPPAPAQPED